MKELPIGIQSFRKIIEGDFLYVDKTKYIHRLLTGGGYYFLARPRRFGKSLTLSTIKEIYLGSASLFKGLWIEKNWDWNTQKPIIHISFSLLDYQGKGLEQALMDLLEETALDFNIALKENTIKSRFAELLKKLSIAKDKAVLLIDEYDKPLIDYLDDMDKAKAHQGILKTFYSVIKDSDPYIQFLLITGVSKFSKVSVFSDLNNLRDITTSRISNNLVGYTEEEVKSYFEPYIGEILAENNFSKEDLFQQIKYWYNGYSWDAKHYVYNPFSVLSYFADRAFKNFWFSTGTPTFLVKLLHERMYYDFSNVEAGDALFESYSLDNLETVSLLFQTGYLTIKKVDEFGIYTLGYPNKEVKFSMLQHLISAFRFRGNTSSTPLVVKLRHAFYNNNLPEAIAIINSIFKNIPSHIFIAKKEAYYHSLIHLVFTYLGQYIESEVHTSDGRIDAVVKTPSFIYLIEFKLDKTAEEALKQIREKAYAERFKDSNIPIVALGINFSSTTKAVDDWKVAQ